MSEVLYSRERDVIAVRAKKKHRFAGTPPSSSLVFNDSGDLTNVSLCISEILNQVGVSEFMRQYSRRAAEDQEKFMNNVSSQNSKHMLWEAKLMDQPLAAFRRILILFFAMNGW